MSEHAATMVMNLPAQQVFACAENPASSHFWCEGVQTVRTVDGDAATKGVSWAFVQHFPATPLVVVTGGPNLETNRRNRKKLLESQR